MDEEQLDQPTLPEGAGLGQNKPGDLANGSAEREADTANQDADPEGSGANGGVDLGEARADGAAGSATGRANGGQNKPEDRANGGIDLGEARADGAAGSVTEGAGLGQNKPGDIANGRAEREADTANQDADPEGSGANGGVDLGEARADGAAGSATGRANGGEQLGTSRAVVQLERVPPTAGEVDQKDTVPGEERDQGEAVESVSPGKGGGVGVEEGLPDWLEPLEDDCEEEDVGVVRRTDPVSPSPSLQLEPLCPLTQLSKSLLQPISPNKTPEKQNQNHPAPGPAQPTTPHHLRPKTRQASGKLSSKLNGHNRPHKEKAPRDCAMCGCLMFTDTKMDEQNLCFTCKLEKKSPPRIVFKKVGEDRWVLRKSEVKEEEQETSKTPQPVVKTMSVFPKRESKLRKAKMAKEEKKETKEEEPKPERTKEEEPKPERIKKEPKSERIKKEEPKSEQKPSKPPTASDPEETEHSSHSETTPRKRLSSARVESKVRRKKRSVACRECEACLRKDCTTCKYCLDKPKYGGHGKMKQKCAMRRCKLMHPAKSTSPHMTFDDGKDEEWGPSPRSRSRPQRRSGRPRKRIYSSDDTTEDEEGDVSPKGRDEEDWAPRLEEEDQAMGGVVTPVAQQMTSYVIVNPLTGDVYQTLAVPPPSMLGGAGLPTQFISPPGVFTSAGFPVSCLNAPPPPPYAPPPPLLVEPKEENFDYECWPPPTLQLSNQPSRENGEPLNYGNAPPVLSPPENYGRHFPQTSNRRLDFGQASSHEDPPPTLVQPKEEETPVECSEAGVVVERIVGSAGSEVNRVAEEAEADSQATRVVVGSVPSGTVQVVVGSEGGRAAGSAGGVAVETETETEAGSEASGVVEMEVEVYFDSPNRTGAPDSERDRREFDYEAALEEAPEVLETFSLAEESKAVNALDGQERALLRFLRVLRRTVLPAHWVCVMAAGPRLQLLQCSKLSTMGDTVLQIEPGFHYQLTVQQRHLLPTHALYDAHPPCFANTSQVVSLLLELESMAVCQGFQERPPQSLSEPVLLVRAATCLLLVPQSQERCDQCQEKLSPADHPSD